jgi:hypothetical protein
MDNMAFTCPLKHLPCTATQEHVGTFISDDPGPGLDRLYFEAGDKLDYMEFFLTVGEHIPDRPVVDDLNFDPELPNCDWEVEDIKKPWPLTLIDCTLGHDNVLTEKADTDPMREGFDRLDELAYAIKNFHNIRGVSTTPVRPTASDILLCAFNNLGGHWKGTCEPPVTKPPGKGSCAPVPAALLFGSYGDLKYIDGSFVY